MRIHVNNEYGKLKSVVVSSADYYNPEDLALNNETIKYYALHGGVPTKEDILREQKDFWDVLKSYGVDAKLEFEKGDEPNIFEQMELERAMCTGEMYHINLD